MLRMDTVHPRLNVTPEQIEAFCRKWQITRLELFGSVLRDDFDDESDVDVLMEFLPGTRLGYRFVTVALELSELFGRKVDPHMPQALSPYIRQRVLDEAEVLYVRR